MTKDAPVDPPGPFSALRDRLLSGTKSRYDTEADDWDMEDENEV